MHAVIMLARIGLTFASMAHWQIAIEKMQTTKDQTLHMIKVDHFESVIEPFIEAAMVMATVL